MSPKTIIKRYETFHVFCLIFPIWLANVLVELYLEREGKITYLKYTCIALYNQNHYRDSSERGYVSRVKPFLYGSVIKWCKHQLKIDIHSNFHSVYILFFKFFFLIFFLTLSPPPTKWGFIQQFVFYFFIFSFDIGIFILIFAFHHLIWS